MPKRRANGEGNIRKRKDGRWEGRYTVGHDPETGKAIIKNVLGKTQAEVKEKLKKAIEENVGIDYGRAKTYTVGNWLEVWYENYAKIKMRPSTYLTYHGYIENHIKPQLGKIPLNDLTTLHLQQFYKKLLAEGRVERIEAQKQPKGLSAKTVRNIHQIISSALKLAIEQRLIARNPADGCALPKAERKEMQTLPVEQLTSFLREAKDSGVFALYYIDLTTGLRRGELLGLKWSDIDLEKGDLRVQRQIGRIDGKIIEMPLKTKNAYRTLPLSADAISVLKIQKCKVGNSEWVFPSPTGGPMSPDSVLHMLQRVLKRAGLPRIRFHDLRHTFATLALQNGVDVKTVSSMLGHYSAGFTLDTYAHVTTDAQLKAALRSAGQADGIVDVLGLGAVDGEDGQSAQIHAALGVLFRDLGILQLLGFIADFIREAAADILRIEQGLGAALGFIRAAEPHGHANAVVFLAAAAHQDLDRHLVAVFRAAFAVPHQLHGDGRAVVRHELQTALDPAGRAHQVIFLGEDGKDLALIAALHTGMLELLDEDLVAGHRAAGEAAGDEDIAGLIFQHDKGKVLAQFDHFAQQGLLGAAGAHGEEHARTLADHGLMHQSIQRFHHLAAEAGLQVLDGAGLVLDGMLDLIA